MKLKRKIRWLGGAAAIVTLLGLITLDTVHPTVVLATEDKLILLSLISALLGVDILLERIVGGEAFPLEISIDGGATESEADDDD